MEIIGLLFVGFVIFLIWHDEYLPRKREKQKQEKKLNNESSKKSFAVPCNHGTAGAFSNIHLCTLCVQEYELQQQELEKARLEEQERKDIEKKKLQSDLEQVHTNAYFLRNMEPVEFEKLVLRVYEIQGYKIQHTPATGDNGIDGFLYAPNQIILVQCKRYGNDNNVGRPAFQQLFGNICDYQQKNPNLIVKGLMVTTSSITNEAKEWIIGKPIEVLAINDLINTINYAIKLDPSLLEEFLLYNPNPNTYYQPVEIDNQDVKNNKLGCKKCGGFLEVREGKYGLYLGCSNYPNCRYTQSLSTRKNRNRY